MDSPSETTWSGFSDDNDRTTPVSPSGSARNAIDQGPRSKKRKADNDDHEDARMLSASERDNNEKTAHLARPPATQATTHSSTTLKQHETDAPTPNLNDLSCLTSPSLIASILGPTVLGPDIIGLNYAPLNPNTDYDAFYKRIQGHGNEQISKAIMQFMRDVRNAYQPGTEGNAMLYLVFNVWRREQTRMQEEQLRVYMGSVGRWLRGEIARGEIEVVGEVDLEAERRYLAHGGSEVKESEKEHGIDEEEPSFPTFTEVPAPRKVNKKPRQRPVRKLRHDSPVTVEEMVAKERNMMDWDIRSNRTRFTITLGSLPQSRPDLTRRQRRKNNALREAVQLRGDLNRRKTKMQRSLNLSPSFPRRRFPRASSYHNSRNFSVLATDPKMRAQGLFSMAR